jgi:hypothetical protein
MYSQLPPIGRQCGNNGGPCASREECPSPACRAPHLLHYGDASPAYSSIYIPTLYGRSRQPVLGRI